MKLSHLKPLRDALLEVDRLPCVEKGKAALGTSLMPRAGGFGAMSEGNTRVAGWNTFNFFFYGKKFEENCARCPETTRVLQSLPRFERDHVMFSALNPHAYIKPHTGPMNGIIRGHLALLAQPGSFIRVGSEQLTWEEGARPRPSCAGQVPSSWRILSPEHEAGCRRSGPRAEPEEVSFDGSPCGGARR